MISYKKSAHSLSAKSNLLRGLACITEEPPPPSPHLLQAFFLRLKPPSKPPPNPKSSIFRLSPQTSLELCTESLGFESTSETASDGWEEDEEIIRKEPLERKTEIESCRPEEEEKEEKREKEFPPLLPWLKEFPSVLSRYFLKAVRRDGRLVLSQIRVEKPEIFKAYRHEGRLKLELAREEIKREIAGDEVLVLEERRRRHVFLAARGRCQEIAGGGVGAPPLNIWSSRFLATA